MVITLALVQSAVLSAAIAIYAWRRDVPGSAPLALALLGAAWWAAADVALLLSPDLDAKVVWAKLDFLGQVTLPATSLAFALRYTGMVQRLSRRLCLLLAVEPALTMLIVATNERHHLVWAGVRLDASGRFLERAFGPWWWLDAAYSYALLTVATGLIVARVLRPHHLYRRQQAGLLLAVFVPWITNALFQLGLGPIPALDLTPCAFPITGLALCINMARFRLLDLVPLAGDALFDAMPDAVVVLDRDGQVLDLNPAARAILGPAARAALGRPVRALLPGQGDVVEAAIRAGAAQGAIDQGEPRQIAVGDRSYRLALSRLDDRAGRTTGWLLTLRDVTEEQQAASLAAGQMQVLELIAQGAPLSTVLDTLARVIEAQAPGMYCSVLLWDPAGACLRHGAAPSMPEAFIPLVDGLRIGPNVGACGTAAFRRELVISEDIAVDPRWDSVRDAVMAFGFRACWSTPILSASGHLLGTFAMYYREPRAPDAASLRLIEVAAHLAGIAIERAQAETQLREAEARYRTLVEQVPAVIYLSTAEPRLGVAYVSPRVTSLLGLRPDEVTADPQDWWQAVHPEDRERVAAFFAASARPGERRAIEYRLRARDGRDVWVRDEAVLLTDDEGQPRWWQGVLLDITERKDLEERLRYQAFHDALTNLPNRAFFLDQLARALQAAARTGREIAVLFLDLDDFKRINDSLGHDAGDQLLVAVADRLRQGLRSGDTAARLGGDEFTVLLEQVASRNEALQLADRIADRLSEPFTLSGRAVFITPSVGIAFGTAADEPAEILRAADLAMYRAKARGKARVAVFEPGMGVAAVERLDLEHDLRLALERDELVLHYQPIVETQSGRIVGMEALVRWNHPRRGLLAPDTFIPLAEETGLVVPLGKWVLREACRQARAWQEAGLGPLVVAVNLAARQLEEPGLLDDVRGALLGAGLAPEWLGLEITESMMLADGVDPTGLLAALRRLGVHVALDDFGAGYSSLAYLRRFPINVLKIDRSFISGPAASAEDAVILAGIISVAHSLGLTVVAEGVESADQAAMVRGLACDLSQGFHFSAPLPADAATTLLRDWAPAHRPWMASPA